MILRESERAWQRAAAIIAAGGLVVFPTDTVYGIGCDPRNVRAIAGIYEAKSRSLLKAIPLLLASPDDLPNWTSSTFAGEGGASARSLATAFWPGALTLVVPRASNLPDELGAGATIAVRVPDHDGLRSFIRRCGGAIAATSANISGEPDATTAQEAARYLADRVQLIIDGGPAKGGVPSTVVDCADHAGVILREGAISRSAIAACLESAEASDGL